MAQADVELVVWVHKNVPWLRLLGETGVGNNVEVMGNDIEAVLVEGKWVPATDPAGVIKVGSIVMLNTHPEQWVGNDGGCQRMTTWLNGKVATVTQFGW